MKSMMKKSLFLTLAIASACGSAFAQTQPTIYGSVIFGHGWEDMGSDAPFGIYSLPANDATQIKSVKLTTICRLSVAAYT